MLAMAGVVFFYTAAAILAGRGLLQPRANKQPRSIPLTQVLSRSENISALAADAVAAVAKHQTDVKLPGPSILEGGWWYGGIRVGRSKNLSLMIDTGSTDIAVNPGLYNQTRRGYATGYNASLDYGTTQPDGCGQADIHFNEYIDHVAIDGVFVARQPLAIVVASSNSTTPGSGNGVVTQFPGDGIIGFTTSAFSQLNSSSWFERVCKKNQIAQCRFGIALGTDGTGEQYLGGTDSAIVSGGLTVAGVKQPWVLTGDVAINGTTVDRDATFLTDTGTVNIIGPIDAIQAIFNATSIRSNLTSGEGCTKVLYGYYDCANPPRVGFSFPYNNTGGGAADPYTVYDIEPKAFAASDDGSGTCISTLVGIDFPSSSREFWILGQSWFQGKYVDHNLREMSMGIGRLVDQNSKVK